MSEIICYLLEPTDRERRYLRRYTSSPGPTPDVCPKMPGAYSRHDAEVFLDEERAVSGDRWPHDDPRWPRHCVCGYEFQEGDEWQLFHKRVYCRQDTGEEMTLWDAPPGAMWYTHWRTSNGSEFWAARGGGPHLYVKTPGGDWDVDGIANNGPGWERSGEPPRVTASPSIAIGNRYHGWLRDGILVDA